MTTRYQVKEADTTVVVSVDPLDIQRIPCWTVTRISDGSMGWHIGKYRSKLAAEGVAHLLGSLAEQGEEID
jgi:hypothetical protein